MKKITLFFLVQLVWISWIFGQTDINDARSYSLGSTVTIEGIVTNGDELGIIRYIQDNTAGIAVYPGTASTVTNFPENVKRGDIVQITGELKEYNNLLEIDPIFDYTVVSSNNTMPAANVIALDGFNENVEGQLIKFENVTFDDGGGTFSGGSTYTFSNGSFSGLTYIRVGSPLEDQAIPLANVNVTGIASQFFNNYQMLIRDNDDIEIASSFYLTSTPTISDITTSGFTVSWETNIAGNSNLNWGLSTALGTQVNEATSVTSHSITLSGLDAGTIYYVEAYSEDGTNTASSNQVVVSTASNSTGEMRVYFNFPVDQTFSSGGSPIGQTPAAMEAAMIEMIDNAQSTIDFAAYNINRTTIVAALTDAHNRGVRVRYVRDDQTANLALQNPTPPFNIIIGNIGSSLMHNKFIAIDADSEDDSWLITGSTNFTDQNLASDFNNSIFIQDQGLVRSYELEMNEMWGSDSVTPDYLNLKFGDEKSDNTPHTIISNGIVIENYFSPSDKTTNAIKSAIETADSDLEFIVLSFTRNDLGNAVLDAHNDGVSVRGFINNINDQGSEFQFFQDNGVNVLDNTIPGETLHHKYAIIDATDPASDPQVVTGSHNWSNGAENSNDENTIIIHDPLIANIYLQEFEARWAGLLDNVKSVNSINGFEANILPNPVQNIATIQLDLENTKDVVVTLWSMKGQQLQSRILRKVIGKELFEMNVSTYPAGNYVLSFQIDETIMAKQLVIVK